MTKAPTFAAIAKAAEPDSYFEHTPGTDDIPPGALDAFGAWMDDDFSPSDYDLLEEDWPGVPDIELPMELRPEARGSRPMRVSGGAEPPPPPTFDVIRGQRS